MRPYQNISVALVISACCLAPGDALCAGGKSRGGGGHGGGGNGANGHAGGVSRSIGESKPIANTRGAMGGSPQFTGSGATHGQKPKFNRDARGSQRKKPETADRLGKGHGVTYGEDHPWSMQRTNEERKLQHRLDVADKLDKLADANGNEHLHETAERMRQKAHEQYDKRLSKIDSKSPPETPEDPGAPVPTDPDEGVTDPAPLVPGESQATTVNSIAPPDRIAASKLTGRQNALEHQMRNEERKLQQQTHLAEKLRAMAEGYSDSALLQSADRLEEQALSRFEERMETIRSFQERHGLAETEAAD
jgi:hypothetical protein